MKREKGEKVGFMQKIANQIVDKGTIIILVFGLVIAFCVIFSSNWVKVENSLAAYLPDTSETAQSLKLMEEEFVTYGSAKIMVENISYDDALALSEDISELDYVSMVQFSDSTTYYNDFAALFDVTFDYEEDDDECLEALDSLEKYLSDYDIYVKTDLGDQASETIANEMQTITVVVAIIVLVVLLITCDSFGEIPVLVLTFVASSMIAKGTNFIFGTISYVSNSVAIVLQLALSVDYAVIYLNRYKVERRDKDIRTANVIALSKAIPEICASSLTTIGGLIAMAFMQYGIGPDLSRVLIKAIIISLITVFVLMPAFIMLFAPLMEKTAHKSFLPKIDFVGKFGYAVRFIFPFAFLAVVVVTGLSSKNTPYVYGTSTLSTVRQSETSKTNKLIADTFTSNNKMALVIPAGDYDKEAELIDLLMKDEHVVSITGLANTDAVNGVKLTQSLNAREFSEALNVDLETVKLLYSAYALDAGNYANLINLDDFSVHFIDMFTFLDKLINEGYVSLDETTQNMITAAKAKIDVAVNQLQGENYSRILIYSTYSEEGDETFAYIDSLHDVVASVYGEEADCYVASESTSQYDLKKTFAVDNTVVSVVSAVVVLIVLLFTFKSAGLPVLLILVIEGCIWINFAFSTVADDPVFFMGYLIVSSIQMGANIDYAIVVSSRYQEMVKKMNARDAMIDSMNFAFPTIVTSGTMMVGAGLFISLLTSEPTIAGIGTYLARGTLISIFVTMFILPSILIVGLTIIEKTSFTIKLKALPQIQDTGTLRVSGNVRGYINGYINANVTGVIKGEVDLRAITENVIEKDDSIEVDEEGADDEE